MRGSKTKSLKHIAIQLKVLGDNVIKYVTSFMNDPKAIKTIKEEHFCLMQKLLIAAMTSLKGHSVFHDFSHIQKVS
jgi:hypothetical protein